MLRFVQTLITSITMATFLSACGGGGGTGEPSSLSQNSGIVTISNNRHPTIGGEPPPLAYVNQSYSFTPEVLDKDNDILHFSITNKPLWAIFNVSTGSLIGTPRITDIGRTDNIIIAVTDNITKSVALPAFSITVIVGGTSNQPPNIVGVPATSVTENQSYSFIPSAQDPDNDTLTFSITNRPPWASFNAATGALTGTPGSNDIGTTSSIGISVSDGKSNPVALATFNITVVGLNLNRPPTITGIPTTSVARNHPYSFTPSAQDPDNDTLTFSITNRPSWASFNTATGALTGKPGTDDIGTINGIRIAVSDGKTKPVALPPFSITVVTSNSPPSINGIPAASVNVNQVYTFTPAAQDPNNDVLTFAINNKPLWASFSTSTGTLSGTPISSDIGSTPGIEISVHDGLVSTSLPTFSITVANDVNIPSITGTPTVSLYENTNYSFTPQTTNFAGNMLTFSITNKPSWAVFNSSTGALTGTPQNSGIGTTANIVISVTDGFAEDVFLSAFSITVESATAILSWVPPTTLVDSNPLSLSEIKGYKIYSGTDSGNLTLLIDINDSSITDYIDTNLAPSTHYYAVTTYTQAGAESDRSTVVSKIINSLF